MSLNYGKSLLSALALAGACGANAAEGGDAPGIVTPAVADFNTCARPQWPKQSLRNREGGTVGLRFLIGDDGAVIDSLVKKSSGFAALDEAAITGIRRCRFKPRTINAEQIGAWMEMQYVWTFDPTEAELKEAAAQAEGYRAQALNGDIDALYKLAQLYRGPGSRMPASPAYATRMLRLAAERGHAQAQFDLAMRLGSGSGVPKNEQESLTWYRKAAEHGSPGAQARLAWMHESGRGLPRDPAQAAAWYGKAAAQGDTNAQIRLARLHEYGVGVEQSIEQAAAMYRAAAEAGNTRAGVHLARLFLAGGPAGIDAQQALAYLRSAAEQRDTLAEGLLATAYFDGKHAPRDMAEAMRMLRRAAMGGDAASMALLGNLLTEGQHTGADPAEGRKWLRKAAASAPCELRQRLARTDSARSAKCDHDAGPPPHGV